MILALYRAKSNGRNDFRFFDVEMSGTATERVITAINAAMRPCAMAVTPASSLAKRSNRVLMIVILDGSGSSTAFVHDAPPIAVPKEKRIEPPLCLHCSGLRL